MYVDRFPWQVRKKNYPICRTNSRRNRIHSQWIHTHTHIEYIYKNCIYIRTIHVYTTTHNRSGEPNNVQHYWHSRTIVSRVLIVARCFSVHPMRHAHACIPFSPFSPAPFKRNVRFFIVTKLYILNTRGWKTFLVIHLFKAIDLIY